MATRPIAAVVLIFASAVCAPGQHHSFRVYGPESGLNNLGIEDIAQDRQGYLWVSSQGGLFRFDFSELQQHLNIMSGTPSRVRLLQNCFERHSGHEMEAFNEFQLRIEETAA